MVDQLARRNGMHPNSEMNAIGWVMFITMAILLLPLLPFFLLYFLIDLLGAEAESGQRTGDWGADRTGSRPGETPAGGEARSTGADDARIGTGDDVRADGGAAREDAAD